LLHSTRQEPEEERLPLPLGGGGGGWRHVRALTFRKIFNILDPITKTFQSPDIDVLGAVTSLQVVMKDLKNLCCDDEFNVL